LKLSGTGKRGDRSDFHKLISQETERDEIQLQKAMLDRDN